MFINGKIHGLSGVDFMSLADETAQICPNCGKEATYVPEYNRYYCFSCTKYLETEKKIVEKRPEEPVKKPISSEKPPYVCPKCGEEPMYVDEFNKYFCPSCDEYIKPVRKMVEKRPVKKVKRIALIEDQEEDFSKELYGVSSEEQKEESVPEETEEDKIPKPKEIFKNYRYRTRILKGTILPILFSLISIQILTKTVFEFSNYFEYESEIILMGFVLGFLTFSGIVMMNLVRAKKSGKTGCNLNTKVGVIALLPILIIFFTFVLFYSLATAWRFATGCFLAAIFPILIVTLYEIGSKGKFFVREVKEDPSKGRRLIFLQ